jgi:hypothetical protein
MWLAREDPEENPRNAMGEAGFSHEDCSHFRTHFVGINIPDGGIDNGINNGSNCGYLQQLFW